MDLKRFFETVYLGDRTCKSIIFDGWDARVRIHVDCISRIRSPSGTWDYYTAEDISDGHIVLSDVTSCELHNDGHLPNGLINGIDVVATDDGHSAIEVSIDSISTDAHHHEVILRVVCGDAYLYDPNRPHIEVR